MAEGQRNTGSAPRVREDPDQPVGAGPAPAAAAKGATAGGLLAALVGALLGAPFGLIDLFDLPVATRVLICAVVGAVAVSVAGALFGGWVGWGMAAKKKQSQRRPS